MTTQQKMQKYQEYVATANFSLTSGRFQVPPLSVCEREYGVLTHHVR